MKAAVYEDVERIVVKEVPKPSCPPDGILVRVEACGICGGDIRNYFQGLKGGIKNQIMGHEISGIVEEAGDGARFGPGDRIATAPDISCGECYYCKRGLVNLCQNHRMLGTHVQGGFAQYIALPGFVLRRGFVEKIPDGLSYIQAAFAEKVSGVCACQERINVSLGDTVVMIGDGPVGCLHSEIARARGAARVIVAGIDRLPFVKRFPVDEILDNRDREAVVKRVLELTKGIGADVVICAVPTTVVQNDALRMVRRRGTVVIYGGAPGDSRRMANVDSNLIHYNEIMVVGSFSYPGDGLQKALAQIEQGNVSVERYISREIPLEGLVQGMMDMKCGKALNIMVRPWMTAE
uniref:alcohol dehydrogenase catalytic domain-containing protein n=1 Tax=Enterocloster aldenensis TaxID=358742 RepID=UPI001F241B04